MIRLVAALLLAIVPSVSFGQTWVTIKGQITLAAVPAPVAINVQVDKPHCLGKGPLNTDDVVVDPKTKGLKNVWVYLRPDSKDREAKLDEKAINPKLLKPAAVTHIIDQPCCQFEPRILALRDGDLITVKNSSPVNHNINLSADEPSPSFNKTTPAGGKYEEVKPFKAQRGLVTFACNVHPWMGGKLMVFDHPYYAITDKDGKFEIKDAPAGAYRIVYRHENGFHKGKEGNLGFPITIAPGADGKTMEIKSFDLELAK